MMTNVTALAITATAEKILPLTHLHPQEQRAAAVNLIGDLYKIADDIDAGAAVTHLTTDSAMLASMAAAIALAQIEAQHAYQVATTQAERRRLAPLIASLKEAMAAYRANASTPKAPAKFAA